MQLGRKPYANPNDAIPEHLRKQLPYAVGKANDQRPQQSKEKRRQAQQKAIDVHFDDHERSWPR